MKNIVIGFILLISVCVGNCFALDALSPRLSLDKTTFQGYLLKPQLELLKTAQEFTAESPSPADKLGKVIFRVNLNGEKLIVRKRVEDYGDEVEVHHALTRVEAKGREKYLGQCWYTIDDVQAVLQESYDMTPAVRIEDKDKGKGYGSVLFAAVIENAGQNGINRFLIYQPTTSLYEKFGFEEIGDYGLSYKNLKPDDPSAFSIARDLAGQRGKLLSVEGMFLFALKTARQPIAKLQFEIVNDVLDGSV
ncbi:MAG: GNAT family N-acetyltransferase [Candidatus Omnitrophota bacterium]